jgi:hypothetical protein
MPVGLTATLTKTTLDAQSGTIAQELNTAFEKVASLHFMIAGTLDETLAALGYTPEDIALLRSAVGDMEQLRTIYEGVAALAAAKDFRAFMRQMWGLGFSGN